jgi:hypothetical protein
VDLIVGEALSGTFGVGGSWVVPAYVGKHRRDNLLRDAIGIAEIGL